MFLKIKISIILSTGIWKLFRMHSLIFLSNVLFNISIFYLYNIYNCGNSDLALNYVNLYWQLIVLFHSLSFYIL